MNLEKIVRGVVITGVFALPLIVFLVPNYLYFPFITGKAVAFRIIVEIIFSAWIFLLLTNVRYRPRLSPLMLSVAVFVSIVALADMLSPNVHKSIWSNFERMEGLVTLLHLLAYFVVAGTTLIGEKIWLWFWRVSLGVASIVALSAIAQSFVTEEVRLAVTFGNPIYLAVYALFNIFIASVFIAGKETSRLEKLILAVVVILQLWTLYLTATRGATLGLMVGLLLVGFGVLFSSHRKTKVRSIAFAGLLVLVVLLGAFQISKDSDFVQGNPALKRFTSISFSEARATVWSIAWEGVKERPILGWGQESFNFVFNKHYDPRMYAQEQWFDRTHNVILDWLIAAGVLGLLSYLSIFLALLWALWKTEHFDNIQKWLIFGLLAAYGLSNLTVFDNITSYLLFFSVLAWVYAVGEKSKDIVIGGEFFIISSRVAQYFGIAAVLVIAVLLVWSINAKAVIVNKTLLTALREVGTAPILFQRGNTESAVLLSRQALETFVFVESLGTYGSQEVREQFAQSAGNVQNNLWTPVDLRQEWYTEAVRALEDQEVEAPLDARTPVLLAALHKKYGKIQESHDALVRALTLTPRKQRVLLELGIAKLNLGDKEEAAILFKQAYESDPKFSDARLMYGIGLKQIGREKKAEKVIGKEVDWYWDVGLTTTYVQFGMKQASIDAWTHRVAQNPNNQEVLFSLASLYIKVGNLAAAVEEVERVVAIYPHLKTRGDQIIEQLRSPKKQ